MLVESACSVERVEEALSTLLPMLPEIHYFRFNPGNVLPADLCIFPIGMGYERFLCLTVEQVHLFFFPFTCLS